MGEKRYAANTRTHYAKPFTLNMEPEIRRSILDRLLIKIMQILRKIQ